MTLSKIKIIDIEVALCKFENKTNLPIYAIKYKRGNKEKNTYIHHSISYTREQAFRIYYNIVLHLAWTYLNINKYDYK